MLVMVLIFKPADILKIKRLIKELSHKLSSFFVQIQDAILKASILQDGFKEVEKKDNKENE